MSSQKKKQGVLLIAQQLGSPNNCARCGSPYIELALHEDIKILDLNHFDLSRDEKKNIFAAYNRQCTERFLCKKCYESSYQVNESYVDNTGQYLYTKVPINDRLNMEYLTVKEVVEKFS